MIVVNLQTIPLICVLFTESLSILHALLHIDPPDQQQWEDHHGQRKDKSPASVVVLDDCTRNQRSQPGRGLVRDTIKRKELGLFTLWNQGCVHDTRERLER